MKRIFILFLALFICITTVGCNQLPTGDFVAATTLPVYELTLALCNGTDISVCRLITDNVSCLHDYTLQANQMQAIERSAAVIMNGAGFEHFLEDIIPSQKTIIDASENITYHSGKSHSEQEHSHEHDPHIWLSPENAILMSKNILNGLLKQFPAYADTFHNNYNRLNTRLEELSAYAKDQLQDLTSQKIVTFHDGFGYLANSYGLEIVHSMEEESGSEASVIELIEVINLIKEHNIHVIFTEKNGSDSAAKIIAAETGTQIYQLDMALSGNSYIEAMYYNIHTLKEALG